MKDMAVVCMNELAFARSAKNERRSQPAIKESRDSANRSCFCCVCVNKIWLLEQEQPIQLPDRCRVLKRDFPTHFRNEMGNNTTPFREVTHVTFAFRNCPGNQ